MIKSKTKFVATKQDMERIFAKNQLPAVKEVHVLGNGEFNAAMNVVDENGKEYVVKMAHPKDSNVLTYEKGMMSSEVFWYHQMRDNTTILIPQVYAADFSEEVIPTSYFIMEMMQGEPLWAVDFKEGEYDAAQEQKIQMLTQIHKIHNSQFGYRQTGLYDTWYEAIRTMVSNLIADCNALGKKTSGGEHLLACIDKHEKILRNCACSMVNFDLWDSNVLYHNGTLCWIDPERSFWGDHVADFITLGNGQMTPLSEKQKEIEIYNKTAENPIIYSKEAEIRYQVAVAYLALIEEVEKYVRYEPDEENYIRNTNDAEKMYEMAFRVLD